jgi:hypothetical protein
VHDAGIGSRSPSVQCRRAPARARAPICLVYTLAASYVFVSTKSVSAHMHACCAAHTQYIHVQIRTHAVWHTHDTHV